MSIVHFFKPTRKKINLTFVIGFLGFVLYIILGLSLLNSGISESTANLVPSIYFGPYWFGIDQLYRLGLIEYPHTMYSLYSIGILPIGIVWWYLIACFIAWLSTSHRKTGR